MTQCAFSLALLPFLQIGRYGTVPIDVIGRRNVADLIGVFYVGLHKIRSIPTFDPVIIELLGRRNRGE